MEKTITVEIQPYFLPWFPKYNKLVFKVYKPSICPVQWDDPENQKGERFFIYNGVRYNLKDIEYISDSEYREIDLWKEFDFIIADRYETVNIYEEQYSQEESLKIPISGLLLEYYEESEFEDNEIIVHDFELVERFLG